MLQPLGELTYIILVTQCIIQQRLQPVQHYKLLVFKWDCEWIVRDRREGGKLLNQEVGEAVQERRKKPTPTLIDYK